MGSSSGGGRAGALTRSAGQVQPSSHPRDPGQRSKETPSGPQGTVERPDKDKTAPKNRITVTRPSRVRGRARRQRLYRGEAPGMLLAWRLAPGACAVLRMKPGVGVCACALRVLRPRRRAPTVPRPRGVRCGCASHSAGVRMRAPHPAPPTVRRRSARCLPPRGWVSAVPCAARPGGARRDRAVAAAAVVVVTVTGRWGKAAEEAERRTVLASAARLCSAGGRSLVLGRPPPLCVAAGAEGTRKMAVAGAGAFCRAATDPQRPPGSAPLDPAGCLRGRRGRGITVLAASKRGSWLITGCRGRVSMLAERLGWWLLYKEGCLFCCRGDSAVEGVRTLPGEPRRAPPGTHHLVVFTCRATCLPGLSLYVFVK